MKFKLVRTLDHFLRPNPNSLLHKARQFGRLNKTSRQEGDSSHELPRTGLISHAGSTPSDFDFSIVFIQDVSTKPDTSWPEEVLGSMMWAKDKSKVEILSFRYDMSPMEDLSSLLDPDRLRSHAENFLAQLSQRLGDCDAACVAVGQDNIDKKDIRRLSRRPIMILAHGYGGLIYEKVYLTVALADLINALTIAYIGTHNLIWAIARKRSGSLNEVPCAPTTTCLST